MIAPVTETAGDLLSDADAVLTTFLYAAEREEYLENQQSVINAISVARDMVQKARAILEPGTVKS